MAKERRLGRGLEALLGNFVVNDGSKQEMLLPELADADKPEGADADWILQQKLASHTPDRVDIMQIDRNPYQPRQIFDEAELDQLAASLQTQGLIQPIVLRQVGDRYQIVAGERRFRAAMRAGWSEVPVHVREVDDRQMVELALTENVHRKDLNPIEKAGAFANYLEMYGGTHDELAKRLELDRSTVTNLMRLLDLPQELQDAIQKGALTQGHARALLSLEPWEQVEVAKRIKAEGWSVRETERYVQELLKTGQSVDKDWNVVDQDGQKRVAKQSEQVVQLEQDFRERLGGLKVKLTQTNEKGKGKLVISFANHAEFEKIYAMICQSNRKAAG